MDEIKKLQKRIRELEEENKQQREEISLLHQEQDTQESLEKFAKSISDIMAIHKLRTQLTEAQARIERAGKIADMVEEGDYVGSGVILTIKQILQGKEGER